MPFDKINIIQVEYKEILVSLWYSYFYGCAPMELTTQFNMQNTSK